MARSISVRLVRFVSVCSVVLLVTACDAKENPYKVPEKQTRDLHKIDNEMTQEELVEARKAAGIKSPEEVAAENAIWYETECRKYIKARLPEYRKLLTDMRALLDDIEKQAPKWKSEPAFEKYAEKHKPKLAEFSKAYNETTGQGGEGGKTQEHLAAAVEAFDQLNTDLGPNVADNEAFPGAIESIRANLDKVTTALDEIEKDDSLAEPAEGEKPAEGAEKPADKPAK